MATGIVRGGGRRERIGYVFTCREDGLVTGGAGLSGRQIVRAMAQAGAHTYVASRNLASLEALAVTLAGEGLTIHPRRLDQGDEASVLASRGAIQSERPSNRCSYQ